MPADAPDPNEEQQAGSPFIQPATTSDSSNAPLQHPMVTRSKVGISRPNPKYANFHAACSPVLPSEPKSLKSVVRHPGWLTWLAAMQEELATLDANKTWDLIPYSPTMNVVGRKWVYQTKIKVDGSL